MECLQENNGTSWTSPGWNVCHPRIEVLFMKTNCICEDLSAGIRPAKEKEPEKNGLEPNFGGPPKSRGVRGGKGGMVPQIWPAAYRGLPNNAKLGSSFGVVLRQDLPL